MEMDFSSSSSENNFRGRFSGRGSLRGSSNPLPNPFQPNTSTPKSNPSKHGPGPSRHPQHPRQQQLQQSPQSLQQEYAQSKMNFDMLAWYPKYQSCQRYFVDHSQHEVLVQCVASFINILLPYQREPPLYTCRGARTASERMEEITNARAGGTSPAPHEMSAVPTSLIPYLRRLIVTGMDVPQILHGFFGDDWQAGIGRQQEVERRNYLFAAKSGGWASVKRDYDMLPLETVPFLIPLKTLEEGEVEAAEKSWSEWLAMEDWMVGSRAPEEHR